MKTFLAGLVGLVVGASVVFGIFGLTPKTAPATVPVLGASSSNEHYNPEYFYNGLSYNKLTPQSFGISTTTPALFGSSAGGYFTVAAGATTFSASTTAVDLNTDINITQISTSSGFTNLNATLLTQLGNLICNTTAATSSPIVSVYSSSTAPSLNGFSVKLATAPTTNPDCFSWSAQGY